MLGEIAHLGLGELDIIDVALRELGQAISDLGIGQPEIPAIPLIELDGELADRRIAVEVKLIATKGEYASWRATRATGDFDLRTFSIRAYPVDKVPELRPGMSAYLDWRARG